MLLPCPPSAQPHERVLRETCRSPEPSAPPVPDPRSCHRVGKWLAPGPAPSLHRQLPWEDLPALCTRSLPRCSRAQGCTSGEPPPWSSSQGQGSRRLRGLDCGVSSGSAPSPACFPVHGPGDCALGLGAQRVLKRGGRRRCPRTFPAGCRDRRRTPPRSGLRSARLLHGHTHADARRTRPGHTSCRVTGQL